MRIICFLSVAIILAGCAGTKKSGNTSKDALKTKLEEVLQASVDQYKGLSQLVPAESLPRTYEKGSLKTTRSDGWVSGFFPGSLLYLYQFSGDVTLKNEAEKKLKLLEKEQFNRNTHDLGFMMYCSFGNANRLSPSESYKNILINSARSLCTRFNPAVGCIRSWDSDSSHFLVIIDNMMNLELLMYAFKQTGDSSFYKIAVTHANTTIKNHFREDFSSYHVVDYDARNGGIQKKRTHQGAADESAWARGQAWGLYGFTMMYRETGDSRYLDQAWHIADFILNHPNLPADKIPFWDFNAPGIPNTYRDASAAAIISSALFELSGYVNPSRQIRYYDEAVKMLQNLASSPYKTNGMEAGGFILQHGVGHLPGNSEIDVPLSYGDYYFIEAAMRYTGKLKIPKY
jgi:hypothetical protein